MLWDTCKVLLVFKEVLCEDRNPLHLWSGLVCVPALSGGEASHSGCGMEQRIQSSKWSRLSSDERSFDTLATQKVLGLGTCKISQT